MTTPTYDLVVHAQTAVLDGRTLQHNVYLGIRGDRIACIQHQPIAGGGDVVEAEIVIPGFVDIHNHGLGGTEEVTTYWTNPDYTLQLLPPTGTTCILASVIPATLPLMRDVMAALSSKFDQSQQGAVIAGLHAEGPIIADLGALPAMSADASQPDFDELLDILGPRLKIMTVAPSLDCKTEFLGVRKLVSRGVRVALGHDRACTLPQIYTALSAAAAASLPAHPHLAQSHITHLFNVCTFNHRAPSLINVGLCGSEHLPNIEEHPFPTPPPSPTVEIIADGVHVHYLTIKTLLTARRPQDVAIITDSILSSKPGSQAAYCGRVIETAPDGAMVVLQGTTTLAGGCKPLWQAFAHLTGALGVDLLEASVMFSTTPARIASLADVGVLRVGAFADFLVLKSSALAGARYQLHQTFVRGRRLFAQE